MRLLSIILSITLSSISILAENQSLSTDIKMQNMHLSMEVFLSNQVKNRGVSAAAWLRFRNTSNKPIKDITFLLNPGLTVTKVIGTKNQSLRFSSQVGNIKGGNLNLNINKITLIHAVQPNNSTELSIQYKGDLKSLAIYDDTLPIDTLTPGFTMIRMENFIYPIIANPTIKAIEDYKTHQRYTPTAKITVPQGYSLAGNAVEQKRTLTGTREQIELRGNTPFYGLTLGLGKYTKLINSAVTHYYLNQNDNAALMANNEINELIKTYNQLLGVKREKKRYILSELASPYTAKSGTGFDFILSGDYSGINFKNRLAKFWQIKNYDNSQHGWHLALTQILENFDNVTEFGADKFNNLRNIIENNPKLGKIAFKKYDEEGYENQLTDAYGLLFAVMHEVLGKDRFWHLLKNFRDEFGQQGANNEDLYKHLKTNIKNKKVKKLMIDWINKGRIIKSFEKADSFKTLIERVKI